MIDELEPEKPKLKRRIMLRKGARGCDGCEEMVYARYDATIDKFLCTWCREELYTSRVDSARRPWSPEKP